MDVTCGVLGDVDELIGDVIVDERCNALGVNDRVGERLEELVCRLDDMDVSATWLRRRGRG